MVQYQSFPGVAGDSKSLEKLKRLCLPDLAGKSFLDVGCNEGFFCGFAKFAGATRVVGIDSNPEFVRRAQARFPECEFRTQSWDRLPDEHFDVIVMLSALHYAEDQPGMIEKLVERLTPNGTLILEAGVVDSDKEEWVSVKRGIDTRKFPTRGMLYKIFNEAKSYGWKQWGQSVSQRGDPTPRYVFHLHKRKPIAYLLMQPSGYGKTSISRWLFADKKVACVSGDTVIWEIKRQMRRGVDPDLARIVDTSGNSAELNIARIIGEICAHNRLDKLVAAWLTDVPSGDIAIDSYIPQAHQSVVVTELERLGYLPVVLSWNKLHDLPLSRPELSKRADAYYESLGGDPMSATVEERPDFVPHGYVDRITVTPDKITITGWAVTAQGVLPPALVVNMNGERFEVSTGKPIERVDVERHLRASHARFGFTITLNNRYIADTNELLQKGFSIALISGQELRFSKPIKNSVTASQIS